MNGIAEALRHELRDPEYSEGYAESFLNAYVATQIKVLREQRGLKQADLARLVGTTQTAISRIENVNYSAWNIRTLKRLARAFRVRLRVSFETYGSLLHDVEAFDRGALQRVSREEDPVLLGSAVHTGAAQPRLRPVICELYQRRYTGTEEEPIGAIRGTVVSTGTAQAFLENQANRPSIGRRASVGSLTEAGIPV